MDTGYKFPTTNGNPYNDWVNPTNAYSNNSIYATYPWGTNAFHPNYGEHTFKTFGFSIPAGATINGIEVTVRGYSDYTSNAARVTLFGIGGGTGTQISKTMPSSNGDIVFGGDTSLWGKTWTANDFLDANFGTHIVAFVGSSAGKTMWIDSASIKVYYTPLPPSNFFLLF